MGNETTQAPLRAGGGPLPSASAPAFASAPAASPSAAPVSGHGTAGPSAPEPVVASAPVVVASAQVAAPAPVAAAAPVAAPAPIAVTPTSPRKSRAVLSRCWMGAAVWAGVAASWQQRP